MKRLVLAATFTLGAACGTKGDAGNASPQARVVATVEAATSERFTETVDATGTVTPRTGHVASLSAPGPARVAKVFVTVGATVKAGDPLVEFDQTPFEAALHSADAALTAAQKGAERAKRLADAGVLPRKDAETAAADLALATANAVNARRASGLSVLRAPIAGVVTRVAAVLGASADAGAALVEVADPSVLDVVLTLAPGDAGRVRTGQAVSFFAGAAASGAPVATGHVVDVAAVVDTASRGVAARVAVGDAKRRLRIGETLFGRVAVAEHANAVMVPTDALVPTGEGFKVFVVDTGGIAHARDVRVGARSDHGVWIIDGLQAGVRVVTKGAYGVDDSTKVVTGAPASGAAPATPSDARVPPAAKP